MADNQKLSLQAFLQVLTSKSLPISRAMAVASKIYKDFNTPARLGELTDAKLLSLGVSDKEDRTLVLSALKNAGYRAVAVTNAKQQEAKKRRASSAATTNDTPELEPAEAVNDDDDDDRDSSVTLSKYGGSSPSKPKPKTKRALPSSSSPPSQPSPSPPSPQKKRKRRGATAPSSSHLQNEYLPGPAGADESVALGNLDFHEILDEDALGLKSTVVNRAPVMMAWASVVAERLGFSREEALSIASVYTEMNAVSKGVSLGIYDKKREAALNVAQTGGGSQPYVDLLGRRVPLYRTASGPWRAFTTEDSSGNSTPGGGGAAPGAAFGYITRALRQTASAVLGAMRLLAESYDDPMELNRMGFTLYADFRPDVNEWGGRGVLKCETILGLRKRRKGEAEHREESIGPGMTKTKTEDGGQVVAKPEEPDKEPAQSPPDDAPDADSGPNDLFDALFDDFTAEELSILP